MGQSQQKPTQKQIDDLKKIWLKDPCWDIEDTDGFQAVREELIEFADQHREKWEKEQEERGKVMAERMGVEYNSNLFKYINYLENRIKQLEQKVFGDE